MAKLYGTPPSVAIVVLPTPVGSGGSPAALVTSKAPAVTTRLAGVAPARAAAVKLNVPARRVPVRCVNVMKPAAPLSGVIHELGGVSTDPMPPGVVPVLTPSGCDAGPMKNENDNDSPRPVAASKPDRMIMPSRVGDAMPLTAMEPSSLAHGTPSMVAVNVLPPGLPPPGSAGPSPPPPQPLTRQAVNNRTKRRRP